VIVLVVLTVVFSACSFVVLVFIGVEAVRRLLGRGEVADVADERTRALIDGDTPLPLSVAVEVNRQFADLINTPGLQQVDADLERFYVIGNDS
jgi:hypothetical protein